MSRAAGRFIALLRGINVGGSNVISMKDLRGHFESLGFEDVRTYIQSGNVLFRSGASSVRELTSMIEAGLSKRFDYDARAVVMSRARYRSAVQSAPDEWGSDDDRKHNALFTLAGATPKRLLSKLPAPEASLESVGVGPGVIFWSASRAKIHKTTIMKLGSHPAYKQVTVRNHRTVFRLLDMLDED